MVNENYERSEKEEREVEYTAQKYAMYNALVFVGGGLVLAWILLFAFYSIR